MPDVETQLREYFGAAVERVTAEDVLARRLVSERVQPRPQRRMLRPAWAAVIAFVATLILLGGSLTLVAVTRRPGGDAGSTSIPDTVTDGAATTSLWWLLVPAIAAVIAIGVALVARTHQSTRRERPMATTIDKHPEQTTTASRTNRWLVATIAVLAAALVALGAWVIYDLAAEPETAAPAEIETLIDDYETAWEENDAERFRALTTEDYQFYSGGEVTTRSQQAAMIAMPSNEFRVERVGDLIVIGEAPEYFVTTVERPTLRGAEYAGISTMRVVETEEGLKVAEHSWVGNL